jgi:hypothetical protein
MKPINSAGGGAGGSGRGAAPNTNTNTQAKAAQDSGDLVGFLSASLKG